MTAIEKQSQEEREAYILLSSVPTDYEIRASIDLSPSLFEEAIIRLQSSAYQKASEVLYCLYVSPCQQFIARKIIEEYNQYIQYDQNGQPKNLLGKGIMMKVNRFIPREDWFIFMEETVIDGAAFMEKIVREEGKDFPIPEKSLPLSLSADFICGRYLSLNKKTSEA